MKNKKTIHFLITGGTIDSTYQGREDKIVPNSKSVIPEFMRGLGLKQKTKFNVICMKDSRDIEQGDREMLVRAVEGSPCYKIIITHGNYSMAETAVYLQKNLVRKDQAIILTGSLVPIRGFAPSDGPFNLGYSVAEINHLKSGIYICMNARIFDSPDLVELKDSGDFSSELKI